MKLRISMKEAVFTKDLDGDGKKAEVPPEREGETLPPEVNIDDGLDDSNNDGKTDSPREPGAEEPEMEPVDDKPEELPGDDELAKELEGLEEQVYNLVKKIIQETKK